MYNKHSFSVDEHAAAHAEIKPEKHEHLFSGAYPTKDQTFMIWLDKVKLYAAENFSDVSLFFHHSMDRSRNAACTDLGIGETEGMDVVARLASAYLGFGRNLLSCPRVTMVWVGTMLRSGRRGGSRGGGVGRAAAVADGVAGCASGAVEQADWG